MFMTSPVSRKACSTNASVCPVSPSSLRRKPALPGAPTGRNHVARSLSEFSGAADVTSTAAEGLSALKDIHANMDGEAFSKLIESLNAALQDPHSSANLYMQSSVSGHGLDIATITHQVQHVDLHTASTHMAGVADAGVDHLTTGAHTSIAGDIATTAASTFTSASSSTSSTFHTLSIWAADRLTSIQAINPDAFTSITGNLSTVLQSAQETLNVPTEFEAHQFTHALVVGLQQLLVSVHDVRGGLPLEATLHAQQAVLDLEQPPTPGMAHIPAIVMFILSLVLATAPSPNSSTSPHASPNPLDCPRIYDPAALNEYFSQTPAAVLSRNAEVVAHVSGFALSLLADVRTGMWEKNMVMRAEQLRVVCEGMGPAYIKIAQMLSTRVDLLPPAYLEELVKLQDDVPTFSTEEARQVLEEGLQQPLEDVFDWISEAPLAAASLGQVYKAQLTAMYGGGEVAVKIQRPGALESVALDVFIMRRAATLFSSIPGMAAEWALVLDEWAARFFQLLEHAETRKREQDLAYERVQVRDRQKEDHLYEDKEKFVTSAYRRKLEEDAKWKAEEKAREEEEKRNDPRNLGHMRNFYSNLLTKNVSYGKVDGGKGVGDKGKEQMDQKEPSPPAAATTSNVPPKPNAPQIELDAYEKLRLEAERALREKKAAEAAGGAGASNGEQEVRREDGGQGSERDERAGASGQVSTSQPRGSVEAVGEGRPVVDGTGTVQDSALHAGKRRNDDTSVVSARERYLARKQQRTG